MKQVKHSSLFLILIIFFLFSCNSNSVNMEIGKVYKANKVNFKPKRGEFLLLKDRGEKGNLTFHTFDVVENKPIANLDLSASDKYEFVEVRLDSGLIAEAKIVCEKRIAQEKIDNSPETKLAQIEKMAVDARKKYKINENYIIDKIRVDESSGLLVASWLDLENKEYVLHIYSDEKIEKESKFKWRSNPKLGRSFDDSQTILDSLSKMMHEIKSKK